METWLIDEPYDFYEHYEGDMIRFYLSLYYQNIMEYYAKSAVNEMARITSSVWNYNIKIYSDFVRADDGF